MRNIFKFIGRNIYRLFYIPLPLIGGWMFYASIERIGLMFTEPDINRDGKFTISDIPTHIWDIIVAPGDKYQAIFASRKIGQFLEMSGEHPHWFWSIVLTGVTYFFLIGGLYWVFAPQSDEEN